MRSICQNLCSCANRFISFQIIAGRLLLFPLTSGLLTEAEEELASSSLQALILFSLRDGILPGSGGRTQFYLQGDCSSLAGQTPRLHALKLLRSGSRREIGTDGAIDYSRNCLIFFATSIITVLERG